MNRYERQLGLPEIGEAGQEALKQASVVVVGIGGLGCVSATYLASAGVGRLGLCDYDIVTESNLNRQICYNESDIGHSKVLCSERYIRALNKEVKTDAITMKLERNNVDEIVSKYDIVIDGSDNYETRFLLSDACQAQGKPFVFGAVCGMMGQVSVLCCEKKTYRDIMSGTEDVKVVDTDKFILGPTAGVIASLQAIETIKLIVGIRPSLIDKLASVDLRTLNMEIYDL